MYLAVNLVSFLTVTKCLKIFQQLTKLPSAMQCLHFCCEENYACNIKSQTSALGVTIAVSVSYLR